MKKTKEQKRPKERNAALEVEKAILLGSIILESAAEIRFYDPTVRKTCNSKNVTKLCTY